ncbi:glycoside hydrolase family 15 protein [Natronorubrum aibiense]|uniref:Glucoamylase n=1 Tax=Natronorubrum aibiense TaxID=348826 RepID=A0A5P9P0M5_9EURY|nr:glycoside hydrolase family 15 protein [Natronorubrum aibiense]QFU81685.1 glucoamylase [Natronorubrum aibiense]
MTMRTTLNEYKHDCRAENRYPGERRSTNGYFTGDEGRLVYVDRSGSIRDYSAGTLGLNGIEHSRFGVQIGEECTWLDEMDTTKQGYDGETTVVITEYDAGSITLRQYDYTLEHAHLTHFELRGTGSERAKLVAALTFAPDGQERSVGQLRHEDVVEVFYHDEHDYVTASTGLETVASRTVGGFDELLEDEPVAYPGDVKANDDLSDTVVVAAPFDDEGTLAQTTLVSLVADHTKTARADALAHVRAFADHYQTDGRIRDRANAHGTFEVPDHPQQDAIHTDLRTLSLLTAPTGARIKGPEYDPYHVYTGGYGYTWFRDDAEIASHLLQIDETFDIGLADAHADSVAFYCQTQLPDGTWPQRVWAHDGSIAPGWAHDRVTGDGPEYQLDASASVLAFLATYLRTKTLEPDEITMIENTIDTAFDGLVDALEPDGLPGTCQCLWEDELGRFTHTAAAVLEAFAAVARAPVDDELQARAEERATAIYEGLAERWTGRGVFARQPGEDRLDVGTLALVSAHREYAAVVGGLDAERLERLETHVETTIDGLERVPDGAVAGLPRYEGDDWRQDEQDESKIWPLAVCWAAHASVELADLLEGTARTDETTEGWVDRSRQLLDLVLPGGELVQESGYLAEQVFDAGTADSATPYGWAHALRSRTVATLQEAGVTTDASMISGPAAHSTWTTGETYGIGTACDHGSEDPSKVWFTLTEGAMTEPRFPRVDLMNFRTVDFLIVDADDASTYTARTHNEQRTDDALESLERSTEMVGTDAPVYRQTITETGRDGHKWQLMVEYVTDPAHDSILLSVNFTATDGNQYDIYVVGDAALAGYLRGTGAARIEDGNGYALTAHETGEADDHAVVDPDGEPYSVAAALASRRGFDWASADRSWSNELARLFVDGETVEASVETGPGHSVLVGRLGNEVSSIADTVALGFAEDGDTETALADANETLDRGYVDVRDEYVEGWQSYLSTFSLPAAVADEPALADQYRAAMMVLKAVEDKTFIGAGIASPSVPWGDGENAEHPRDFGYNFSWARDLYQVFTALRAAGDVESAREALEYIYTYQQRDNGFLPQNTYLDGRTRWGGEQLDNIAFPSVMAYQLVEHHGIDFESVEYDYETVRRSVEYLLRSGPHSGQERWEEEAGYSPSTIAAEIAGIACAAPLADAEGERADALTYLAHADDWRVRVDDWCATETGIERYEQTPYYVRVTRNGNPEDGMRRELANNGPTLDERAIIDAGFLELVRLGIRDPHEEIIENSVAVVDETIRVETPYGPAWYRYNGDGYGEVGEDEPDEGGPWTLEARGSGRLWPIFTGERAEYELLAGTEDGPLAPDALLETMCGFANSGRMIPEQVWDREYPTEYGWEFGEGTGSATPLAWSMAQFVRLSHAIDAGSPVETPRFIAQRYEDGAPTAPSLSIEDVTVTDDTVTIIGESDGDELLCWLPDGHETIELTDGAFETTLDAGEADYVQVIAATDDDDLVDVGTALETVWVS